MEEFGMGSLEILKALSPFPGFGITGWICGAVSGGLVSLGLFFGSDDLTHYPATGKAIAAARTFIPRFEKVLTSILCPKIQEDVIFGRYMDQRANADNLEAFIRENGFVKCALPAGIGARIAAEIIIESMEDQQAA
jgi:hypothetical protein